MTPEEEEIQKRTSELKAAEDNLAQVETEYADHRVRLKEFEQAYLYAVQFEHVEMARWEGLISHQIERVHALQGIQDGVYPVPENPYTWRPKIQQSKSESFPETEPIPKEIERGADIKALYRELARRYHPDLSETEASREQCEAVMREINSAYQAGNLDLLVQISHRPEIPDSKKESLGDRLVWLIRRQAQVAQSVESAQNKLFVSRKSPLSLLMDDCSFLSKEKRFVGIKARLKNHLASLKEEWLFHCQQEAELWKVVL